MGSSFDGTRQSVNRAQQVRISAASGREQRRRTARAASAAETEALTLTLTGCGSGIGVGLDGDNCVDMLKPGMPAAKVLQMGDRVVSWNGIAMMEDGNQRMLKDVVTPAESHELVVERVRASPPISLEDVDWDNGLTCVEFMADNELRLGVYVSYTQVESEPHIRPLCASSADEGVGALLCDEGVPSAPLSSVRRVLDPDYVFVSERQAGGGQGLGNPHGEHGEECYDLRDLKLSPNVRVVVQEGRDQERVL